MRNAWTQGSERAAPVIHALLRCAGSNPMCVCAPMQYKSPARVYSASLVRTRPSHRVTSTAAPSHFIRCAVAHRSMSRVRCAPVHTAQARKREACAPARRTRALSPQGHRAVSAIMCVCVSPAATSARAQQPATYHSPGHVIVIEPHAKVQQSVRVGGGRTLQPSFLVGRIPCTHVSVREHRTCAPRPTQG